MLEKILREMESRGIEAKLLYLPPVHLQPASHYLGYREGDFPVTERVSREMLSLPLYPELTEHQIEEVAQTVRDCLS